MPEPIAKGRVVAHRHRGVRDWLHGLIVNDSARPFVWLYYSSFFLWGLWGAFWAYPIALIIEPMSLSVYDVWVWTPLVATPVALGGLALRHGGSAAADIKGPLLRADYLGLWMQVGGHACMFVVLAVFVGTAIYGAEPHQPVISVFIATPYVIGVAFLTVQCMYKIRLGRPAR